MKKEMKMFIKLTKFRRKFLAKIYFFSGTSFKEERSTSNKKWGYSGNF